MLKKSLPLALPVIFTACSSNFWKDVITPTEAPTEKAQKVEAEPDPYLWLEPKDSPQVRDFITQHNARTKNLLEKDPRYAFTHGDLEKLVYASDRIPQPELKGDFVYNFWQDDKAVRGVWRRTRFESYSQDKPNWESVLDLDALAKSEKKDWVWQGADCLPPEYRRCLLQLSLGGKDASVVREFDTVTKKFISDGFNLPEAKSVGAWVDANTVIVATDFGPGSLTESGYPRQAKLWTRGQKLEAARPLLEGSVKDVDVVASTEFSPEGAVTILQRRLSFSESEYFEFTPSNRELRKIPVPADAEMVAVFQKQLFLRLRSDWRVSPSETLPQGALVAFPLYQAQASPSLVWAPSKRSSLLEVRAVKDHLYFSVLDNVSGRLFEAVTLASGAWRSFEVQIPPKNTLNFLPSDSFSSTLLFEIHGFLQPPTVEALISKGNAQELKSLKALPARFDASALQVDQFEARSRDGTEVPYFAVHQKALAFDGRNPTLLYAYGGFNVSMTPWYSGARGKLWMEKGGVLVVANIRGGGEFGPRWHQAAKKENRQKAFDDFIAVSEDLIARKITSPAHLGIQGGSNGGLLVAAVTVQRPELFKAVICQVPLTDMLRYAQLPPGASWMDEYGDPADEKMAAALRAYSPYQNVKRGVHYPRIFFSSSSADDRVNPAHARKMVARLEEYGNDVLYFEDFEGGHGGNANLKEIVDSEARNYIYLYQELF